ncbi:MAG: hypothetical protein M3256_01035 [Actinomycetota bacterium]|nr:hypothetical protein [Actinomycetota bacterium]
MKTYRLTPRTPPQTMRVGLTFEFPPGGKSEYLVTMLLMAFFSELKSSGVEADHIAIQIDGHRQNPTDTD